MSPFGTIRSLWESDHIVPVVEGGGHGHGGDDPLANRRTLCQPCHKAASRELRKRLAERRRAEKVAHA